MDSDKSGDESFEKSEAMAESIDDSIIDTSNQEKPNARKWQTAMFSPRPRTSDNASFYESPISRPSKRLDDSSSAKKKKNKIFNSTQLGGEVDGSIATNWWTSCAKDVDKIEDTIVISSSEDDFDENKKVIKELKSGIAQSNELERSSSPEHHPSPVQISLAVDTDEENNENSEPSFSDDEYKSSPRSGPFNEDTIVLSDCDDNVVESENSEESDSDGSEKLSAPKTPGGTRQVLKASRKPPTFDLLSSEYLQEIDNSSETRIAELRAERIKLQCEVGIKLAKKNSLLEKAKGFGNNGLDAAYQHAKIKFDMKKVVKKINAMNRKIKVLNKLIGDKKNESEALPTPINVEDDGDVQEIRSPLREVKLPIPRPLTELQMDVPEPFQVPDLPSTYHHNVPSSTINLPKATTDIDSLGRKALETHNMQQALTAEALGTFHIELNECAKLGTEIEDPSNLKVSLLPHQKEALRWMVWRETKKTAGGILADDMGLGKTLTTISLILRYKEINTTNDSFQESDEESYDARYPVGGTLVVAPASVMSQWESEVDSKVKRNVLSVMLFHGPKKEMNPRRISKYDIVVTTYPTMQKQGDESPLYKIRWTRVILDEAHIIRNHTTLTAQSVFKLRRKFVWALTGTPIHNKELDFYSLMKFLKCKPFNDLALWKKWIDNKDAAGQSRLNTIIKTILLRRTKAEIQSAGGLQSLKTKEFSTIRVVMEGREMKVYEEIALFSSTVFANYIQQQAEKESLLNRGIPVRNVKNLMQLPKEEDPFKDHPHLAKLFAKMRNSSDKIQSHEILVLLLRLRQMCCHPYLAMKILDKNENEIDGIKPDEAKGLADDLMNLSIAEDELSTTNPIFDCNRISSKVKAVIKCVQEIHDAAPDDKIIVVSQWTGFLNLIDCFIKEKGINSVALTGEVAVKDRAAIINNFNKTGTEPKLMLLSLTAGGTGLNLIGANHLLLADIHWNPQLEAQACDRIYRVGQPKKVYIYKFICNNTIEEQIEALQLKKLQLAKDVLSGSIRATSSKLTLQDLKTLFKVA